MVNLTSEYQAELSGIQVMAMKKDVKVYYSQESYIQKSGIQILPVHKPSNYQTTKIHAFNFLDTFLSSFLMV